MAPPTSGTLGTFNGCTYTAGGTIVIVAIAPVPLTPAGEVVISNPAPVSGLGHQAVCGPSVTGGSVTLEGALDNMHSVEVIAPSCAEAAQFAARAYAQL